MTVRELIERLSSMPQDATVLAGIIDGNMDDVRTADGIELFDPSDPEDQEVLDILGVQGAHVVITSIS